MEYRIRQTERFAKWLGTLRDLRARIAIARRIERMAAGNSGDVRSVGGQVSEMKINVGPGYRVYFTIRRRTTMILLAGGNKRTQQTDISKARKLAEDIHK